MECLEGVLSRVLWHEVPKWTQTGIPFLIGKLHNGSIIKGDCRKPVVGDSLRLWGEWREQKGRTEQAFEFSAYEPIVDESDQGMIHYLKTYVPTIGVVKATAIAEVFGVETLRILRTNPERAAEVQGISPENVEAIRKHFTERTEIDPAAYARLIDLFKEHRVPRTIIKRLLKDWGSDAPSIVTDHPYLLLAYPRLGWKTVDAFALTTVGYDPAGIERHEAAIGEGLERLADQGHTYGSRLDIEEKAFALVGGRPAQQAWVAAVASGLIYSEDWERKRVALLEDLYGPDALTDTKDTRILAARERCAIEFLAESFTDSSRFALPKYADAERIVAERLAALSKAARPLPFTLESDRLNDDQARAAQVIAENGVVCLVGPPGVGKAQPLDATIYTVAGPKRMGEVNVGDLVIGSDGRGHAITGVFPQGVLPVYEVEFSDGTKTRCCGDHLWDVQDRHDRKRHVHTTRFLAEDLVSNDNHDRWSIPMVKPVEFESGFLPVDPYLLGVLIGDGCFRGKALGLSNPEIEIQSSVRSLVPAGIELTPDNRKPAVDFRLTRIAGIGKANPLRASLEALGLIGCYSTEKFIPELYRHASRPDRIAFLQGLLDTDAYCNGHNIEYSTSSRQLMEDVTVLVNSLGGRTLVKSRIPSYVYKGEKRNGALSFRIMVILPPEIEPFRLRRKLERYIPRTKYQPRRAIVSIRLVGSEECRCISIDSPDHLYCTDHFILTHNTWTITSAIDCLMKNGVRNIRVVTPTGKASKRAAELLAKAGISPELVPCTTIHRALGPVPSSEPIGVSIDNAKVNRGREPFGFSHGPRNPLEVDFLVIDECFPAGTLIDAPNGARDIASVSPGDAILNAAGVDHVIAVAKQEIDRVVRVNIEGQEALYCSRTHPFFTSRGLIVACELRPGDSLVKTTEAVRLLCEADREAVAQTPAFLQSLLQRALVDAISRVQQQGQWGRVQGEVGEGTLCFSPFRKSRGTGSNRTYPAIESNRSTGGQREDFAPITGDQTQTACSGWEWTAVNGATETLEESAWAGLDSGISHSARWSNSGIPDELQGRSSLSDSNDRDRDRWVVASLVRAQGTRREEGCDVGFARVDGVEVLEQGDSRLDQFRDADGKLYFYDLQAARHQSFSVGGLLVHNCSMVDAKLAAALLSAIPLGCRVVFVGDHNQLPSVGPGAVLRDMMEAGIPTAVLTKIERSDSAGRVVHACHTIKDGDTPFPSKRIGLPVDNWVHIELSDPDEIAQTIVGLHEAKATFPDLLWDFQVVSAEKGKKKFACGNLNRLLSEKLNPPPREPSEQATQGNGWAARGGGVESEFGSSDSSDDESGYGPPFRKGDKIVRTKNGLCDLMREASPEDHVDWRWRGQDWSMSETDIVNGDMGRIEDIVFDEDEGERWVVVQFRTPERLCRLAYSECHLIQAYAMSVHKSQGSGWPFVIVPVHESFYWDRRTHTGLWCRELFYTAISRTERLLVTVGQFSSIRSAIGRRTIHQRRTRLVDLIKQVMPERPAAAVVEESESDLDDSETPAFSIPTPQEA